MKYVQLRCSSDWKLRILISVVVLNGAGSQCHGYVATLNEYEHDGGKNLKINGNPLTLQQQQQQHREQQSKPRQRIDRPQIPRSLDHFEMEEKRSRENSTKDQSASDAPCISSRYTSYNAANGLRPKPPPPPNRTGGHHGCGKMKAMVARLMEKVEGIQKESSFTTRRPQTRKASPLFGRTCSSLQRSTNKTNLCMLITPAEVSVGAWPTVTCTTAFISPHFRTALWSEQVR